MRQVFRPESIEDIRTLLARARQEGRAVSISGGRHAMGGQQFARDALHIDMSGMSRVVRLDREKGIVTVEAGIDWPTLIAELRALQQGESGAWSIVQKQTGADKLSIGGALSANVHGRGLAWKPMVQDVEAFRLMQADGHEIEVDRKQHPELFRLVIGGYGLFGVITTVDLRVQRISTLRRDVTELTLHEFVDAIGGRIEQGYLYGDLQFKTDERADDFLTVGVFSAYLPVPQAPAARIGQRSLADDEWRRLFALGHLDKARAYALYRDFYLSTDGQFYDSDTHQLSFYDPAFDAELLHMAPTYPAGSLMITELYVPLQSLEPFMRSVADDFRKNGTNLIYGTIRLVRRDDETLLAWARQDFACVVMNLRVQHDDAGIERAKSEFRRLIDRALENGGSYFLTYHRWARKDQVLAAYPQFVEFLRLKRRYDPEERFQSEWYRHYVDMFAAELGAP